MSLLTSPDPIIVHPVDTDSLFLNFTAHMDADDTIASDPAPIVSASPAGLVLGGAAPMTAQPQVLQVTYSPSPANTYDVLARVTTAAGRTINRTFVVKVRDY